MTKPAPSLVAPLVSPPAPRETVGSFFARFPWAPSLHETLCRWPTEQVFRLIFPHEQS